MTFCEILYTIFIYPIELFLEFIYMSALHRFANSGTAIIVLSLVVNILILPLYRSADRIQEKQRLIEESLKAGINHIKSTFTGDEKVMILQTYYRQNHYSPINSLKSLMPLFLEIPFFIAAYHFLSNLELLRGASFGIVNDLGIPDALLNLRGFNINILPFIMTITNLAAAYIYTRGQQLKEKIQLYGMAFIFLVMLYNSPAGLVIYWTLNNIFNLFKTILYKVKQPLKVFCSVIFVLGIGIIIYCLWLARIKYNFNILRGLIIGFALLLPYLALRYTAEDEHKYDIDIVIEEQKGSFFCSCIFLFILTGLYIPSGVISASANEFVDVNYWYNPLWYIVSAVCIAFGCFCVWLPVFYKITDNKQRGIFTLFICISCVIALIDFMFFRGKAVTVNNALKYILEFKVDNIDIVVNIITIFVFSVIVYWLYKNANRVLINFMCIVTVTMSIISGINIFKISNSLAEIKNQSFVSKDIPGFSLDKKGKNVVFIMLDMAFNGYMPYYLNEKPELKEMFSGFTYYVNTISYGGHTNIGSPVVFGGYEYTPENMNKRDDMLLKDKHNEAIRLMPLLFDRAGYKVSLFDIPFPDYKHNNLSFYDEYKRIHKYVTYGKFDSDNDRNAHINANKRNFFFYSLMKIVPLSIQRSIYDGGNYNCKNLTTQVCYNNFVSNGNYPGFMSAYNVLSSLPSMTKITDNNESNFMIMCNNTAHDAGFVQEPEYIPSSHVDNTEYEINNSDRYIVDGKKLKMETIFQYSHYQSQMAAMLQIGKWLNYLKENDVYDNTKIIIAADHGYLFEHFDEMLVSQEMDEWGDLGVYYPLLMVKDFYSQEFSVSEQFMTQADVPTLAFKDSILNPINPFTYKKIESAAKMTKEQHVLASHEYNIATNNGKRFLPGKWLSVHTDMRKRENWHSIPDPSIKAK